jgi:hypothetical protein
LLENQSIDTLSREMAGFTDQKAKKTTRQNQKNESKKAREWAKKQFKRRLKSIIPL